MALIKKLTRIGNSYGVILPTEILKVAGMEPEGEYEIQVKEGEVSIHPHRKEDDLDKRVMESMTKFMKKYRADLKKLAS